jgi:hypothetical protein
MIAIIAVQQHLLQTHTAQALIQCAGCARREAIAALRRHNNNPSKALKSELARLRVGTALLSELVAEYATQRGLQQPSNQEGTQEDMQQVGQQKAVGAMPAPLRAWWLTGHLLNI